MIRSMTGFGAGRATVGSEAIEVEVRSVNHKFCDVKVRLPRELASLELEVMRAVKEKLARGGVEVTLRRTAARGASTPRVEMALAEEYARAFSELKARLGLPGAVEFAHIIAAEGVVVLEERGVGVEEARAACAAALAEALAGLATMREREGEALARDLSGRIHLAESLVDRVETLAPQAVEHYRARLQERIEDVGRGLALEPGRVAQEVALFADRMDVSEEITRLRSHLEQIRALVSLKEPAGRKMEFLVQEMQREANTVGAKSQSAEIASIVVGLKAELERMREQIQNVE